MSSSILTRGSSRKSSILLGCSFGGLFGYSHAKAKYDPPHLVWDLDNTILCSVTPLPTTTSTTTTTTSSNINKYLDSFDQIDDDFPFDKDGQTPNNTRTYWRPGARTMLKFCSYFAVQHIYTTAQGTYTDNILNALDPSIRSLFQTIIHRDVAPSSVKKGKDLSLIVKAVLLSDEVDQGKDMSNSMDNTYVSSSLLNRRMVLFDDRVKNFTPQNGFNGIHVWPFQIKVEEDDSRNQPIFDLNQYCLELLEVSRMASISVLCLLVPDVRSVVSFFKSKAHDEKFPHRSSR